MQFQKYKDISIMIFAKPPIEGEAKTRLSLDIGDKPAIQLYKNLFTNTIDSVNQLDLENKIICTYGTDNFIQDLKNHKLTVFDEQTGFKMHEKVYHAFTEAFKISNHSLIIVADDYFMSGKYLDTIIPSLKQHKVLIGPTFDGGLYLIGASKEQLKILEGLPFSKPNLCATLLKRSMQKNYQIEMLPKHIDIDTSYHLKKAQELAKQNFIHPSKLDKI